MDLNGQRLLLKNMSNQKKANAPLVIASGNAGKIKEFGKLLSKYSLNILSPPSGFEVDENGQTFVENARIKALKAAEITGKWALADDSGLSVKSLDGAPGVHSSRYAKSDQQRITRLLQELEPFNDRTARFTAALCISSSQNDVFCEVEAHCDGVITKGPRGTGGFGYDPIFEVNGTGLTFAEMGREKKEKFSHRGKAFQLLEPALHELIKLINDSN